MIGNQWIDVKMKDPELGIGVILHLNSGFITVGYRGRDDNGNYWWQLFGDIGFAADQNDYVTHWMFLPTPP